MKAIYPLTFIALSVVAPLANGAPHSASGIILTYDQNNNDELTLEEFVHARRTRFNNTDTNQNGTVEEDEYVYEWEGRMTERMDKDRQASVKQTQVRFNAIDKNGDFLISREEMDAVGARGFEYLDQNQDGVVLSSDPEPQRPDDAKAADKGAPKLEQRRMLRMPTTHTIPGFVMLYDKNGDGKVSRQEFESVRGEQFARTDENNDGKISEQEYQLEFEDRLDAQYEKTYDRQVKQTYVRFDVLDKDEDGHMSFNEYMQSGFRAFSRYDTSGDGVITVRDPAPVFKREDDSNKQKTDTATNVARTKE